MMQLLVFLRYSIGVYTRVLSNNKHYNHYNNNHNINNTDIMFKYLVLINIELPTVNNVLWCCVDVVLLL